MAEATDRPQSSGEVPSSDAAPRTDERVSPWPARAAATDAESGSMPETASEPYRPLSLLALAGFGVAAVYALVVLLGGAVALVNHIPWLLPTWTFIIPFIALLICWAGRTRIRNSEGTLSGLAFTIWGLRLSIVVGLTYAAYYGFAYFAVRLQAIDCADQFFEQIKQDRIDRAFLLGVGVDPRDADEAELRDRIEAAHNSPGGRNMRPGPFSQFRQSEYVRLIQIDGPQTQVVPLGVVEWSYEQGGYQVLIKYQVHTSLANFEMLVKTSGRDSKPGEPKGRRWQVMLPGGQTQMLPSTMKFTSRGEEFMKNSTSALGFATLWQEKVNLRRWDEAYLDTLAPAERQRLRKGRETVRFLSAVSVAGLTPLGLYDEACRDFLAGRQKFSEGGLMRYDDKTFWTNKTQRADIKKRIEQTFHVSGDGQGAFSFQILPSHIPFERTMDGERTILLDAQLVYMDEGGMMPKYGLEGQIAVTVDERELDRSSPPWRIQSIELSSGRTAPTMPAGGRPGGGPGQPGPGMPGSR